MGSGISKLFVVHSVPEMGFNMETVEYKNIKFLVWDMCGQEKIRLLWRQYYQNIQALVFVVDFSDYDRIDIVREELQSCARLCKLTRFG